MDERIKVPCVLQDFVPLGAAALLPLTPFTIIQSRATGIPDHILPLGDLFFKWFGFGSMGLDLGFEAGNWALGLGFGPRGMILGYEPGNWAWMMEIGPLDWVMGLKGSKLGFGSQGGGGGMQKKEKEEKEKFPHV